MSHIAPVLTRRLQTGGWTLGRKTSTALQQNCAAKSCWEDLSDCPPAAITTNGSSDAARNVSVPRSLYTKPRNGGKNCKVCIKKTATGNPEKTETKLCSLPFHGKRSAHSIFSPRLALFRATRAKVQGVLCKSRTWQHARQGVDNVMRFSVRKKI